MQVTLAVVVIDPMEHGRGDATHLRCAVPDNTALPPTHPPNQQPRPHWELCGGLHHWEPFVRLYLPIEFFELACLKDSHVTTAAALLAPPAHPPVLAGAAAAALLACATLPPVLTDAAAAALLALAALPPVLADAGAAALLAGVALPPVLADAAAAALLALAAPPPVLAEAGAAAILAPVARPPVLAEAATAALLAPAARPPVLAEETLALTTWRPNNHAKITLGATLLRVVVRVAWRVVLLRVGLLRSAVHLAS